MSHSPDQDDAIQAGRFDRVMTAGIEIARRQVTLAAHLVSYAKMRLVSLAFAKMRRFCR